MNLASVLAGMKKRLRKPEPEQPTLEQLKQVIEQAERFDKLQALPVWEDILRFLLGQINTAAEEQAKCIYDPEQGRIRHLIWNSKRQIVDDMQGWIESTQVERDRIIEMFNSKENVDGGNDRI